MRSDEWYAETMERALTRARDVADATGDDPLDVLVAWVGALLTDLLTVDGEEWKRDGLG